MEWVVGQRGKCGAPWIDVLSVLWAKANWMDKVRSEGHEVIVRKGGVFNKKGDPTKVDGDQVWVIRSDYYGGLFPGNNKKEKKEMSKRLFDECTGVGDSDDDGG